MIEAEDQADEHDGGGIGQLLSQARQKETPEDQLLADARQDGEDQHNADQRTAAQQLHLAAQQLLGSRRRREKRVLDLLQEERDRHDRNGQKQRPRGPPPVRHSQRERALQIQFAVFRQQQNRHSEDQHLRAGHDGLEPFAAGVRTDQIRLPVEVDREEDRQRHQRHRREGYVCGL